MSVVQLSSQVCSKRHLPWFPLLHTYPPTALQYSGRQYRPLGSAGVGEDVHWIPRHFAE
jgi:hypothetical protein